MNRADICETARKTICEDRQDQYGEPENNFAKIAEYWSIYLCMPINAYDVAIMMTLLKVAREDGHKLDTYVDLCGYAAIAGELVTEGV